jgi:lambda family phage portal protein
MFERALNWLRNLGHNAGTRYAAARLSRYVDFFAMLLSPHRQRLTDLTKLRAHSRELVQDNVYAARYIELVSTNVVGPDGINYQSEIKDAKGILREDWNAAIEQAFAKWGECCTTDGRLGWVEAQQLIAETVATDGEVLIRLVRGYSNDCGFAIDIIDADRLDHTYSEPLKDGSRIIGGVEMDSWGRRNAYWLWTAHPEDYDAAPRRTRIPAEQIIHLYREDRSRGVHGVPWLTPCMVQLNMVGRLWSAELAAANYDADRIGVIENQAGADGFTEFKDCKVTAQEITSDHATFLGLDAGQKVTFPTPQHPNSVLPMFTAFLLKGLASGLNVAYHSLTADLSESKFSSDRTGLIQERDHWRKKQGWFIRGLCSPVMAVWLEMAILSGVLRLPGFSIDKASHRWDARSWDWVDPKADIAASDSAIEKNLSTLQQELGARGMNWRDVLVQRAEEKRFAESLNPVAAATAAEGAVQDTALNGAQVSSLLEIINAVAAGTFPKATAEAMIVAAFPAIDPAKVTEMLQPIAEGSAKPKETAKKDPNQEGTNAPAA